MLELIWICVFLFFLLCVFLVLWALQRRPEKPLALARAEENPILGPLPEHWWESEAVFNPGAVVHDGKVHLFYRALGPDGLSRIGYAVSDDGIHFERLPHPIFEGHTPQEAATHYPYTSPARLTYDQVAYASGGGWGGCEDPRAVKIEGVVYLSFNMFNGWESMRVALTALDERQLSRRFFAWRPMWYLSRPRERHKNWVIFPEKIGGKYAVLHSVYGETDAHVRVAYLDELSSEHAPYSHESSDPQRMPDRSLAWHHHMRSAGAPPLKTPAGWLVFYHASDAREPHIGYKLGALLLDLNDPSRVIARSRGPVLEPTQWYENDWKPGVIIASGAVVFGDDLIVYYGGGDKYVAAARANLTDFLQKLTHQEHAVLTPVTL